MYAIAGTWQALLLAVKQWGLTSYLQLLGLTALLCCQGFFNPPAVVCF
jgi:hypothetical protein